MSLKTLPRNLDHAATRKQAAAADGDYPSDVSTEPSVRLHIMLIVNSYQTEVCLTGLTVRAPPR